MTASAKVSSLGTNPGNKPRYGIQHRPQLLFCLLQLGLHYFEGSDIGNYRKSTLEAAVSSQKWD